MAIIEDGGPIYVDTSKLKEEELKELSQSANEWYVAQYKALMEAVKIPSPYLPTPTPGRTSSAYNLGNYARMGQGYPSMSPYTSQYISSMYPATAGTSPSYNKQKAEEAAQSTKVVGVKKYWLKPLWPNFVHADEKHKVMGCCVCKTKTPANMPWWKPFKVMKVTGLLKKTFPYKDIYSTSRLDDGNVSYDKRDYYFAVCSDECEHFIYLALLDV